MVKRWLHFVTCKADQMKVGQRKRFGKFHKVHEALKTASVIYNSLVHILIYLKDNGDPPQYQMQYEYSMDKIVEDAWRKQKLIG